MRTSRPLALLCFATALAEVSAAILSTSAPQRACVDIVAAAKDLPEQQASFTIYTRCRKNGIREGALERSCRELARLYSVARHYSEASGQKLASEDFCTTAIGAALQEGPMQEVDACVAGAEEVLSSAEVTEAAETACRRAHPSEAEAPRACQLYVKSLAEALQRAPQGELVDAEAICGQLVHGAGVKHRSPPLTPSGKHVASDGEDKAVMDERKFVTSCVQFAGSLMSHPGVGEDDVRKSCEAHLPGEEKTFCDGYARLVFQRADAGQFSKFCVDEYRKMTTPAPKTKPAAPIDFQKKASATAMSMPALCARLFDQATSSSLSSADFKRTARDLCTQELGRLPPPQRPLAAKIRVGCSYFSSRLVSMKEEEGSTTNATEFCARISSPQHAHHPKQQPLSPVGEPEPHSNVVKVVAKRSAVQRHETAPAQVPAKSQISATSVTNVVEVAPPSLVRVGSPPQATLAVVAAVDATHEVVNPQVTPSPPLAPNAALPALMAAASVAVPVMPGAEESAKVKSDEDFLGKFLNKYEKKTSVAVQAAPTKPSKQPVMKVFREDEMAEVRRKAEQLFGNDVDIVSTGAPAFTVSPPSSSIATEAASAATVQGANAPSPVSSQPVVVAAPELAAVTKAQVVANPPVAVVAPPVAVVAAPQANTASKVASPAEAGSSKKQTSMLGVDSQVDASSDFLSSFLNAYTTSGDASKLSTPQLPIGTDSNAVVQLQTEEQSPPPEVTLPAAVPQSQEPAATDVESMVSAFLARN